MVNIIETYYTLRQKVKYCHSNSLSLGGVFYKTIIPLMYRFGSPFAGLDHPTGSLFIFFINYFFLVDVMVLSP